MQKINLIKEPIYLQKKSAFEFQIKAEEFTKNLEYAGIFHEQGLGKTKIALDIILFWLSNKMIDTVLLVTKKGLITNWERETKTHTFLKPKILTQNSISNSYIYNSPTRLIFCHYEVIPTEIERLQLFCKTRNVAIILDEAAKIKNPNSNLTKSFFKISSYFQKRIIMTGTPVANRPFDIWALIYFLDFGKSLGADFENFKSTTDLSNELTYNETRKYEFEKSVSSIFNKIDSFCVRETKKGSAIDLPDKIYYRLECDWEYYQKDMYDQIRNELSLVVNKNGLLYEDDSSPVIKRLLRLIQVTSNPGLIDNNYTNEPGKLMVLRNLVYQITSNNEKVIIWTNFIDNIHFLSKELRDLEPLKIYGKMTMAERDRSIFDFLNDETKKVLIATPASAKEGLTLTVANHAIYYDRNFSLDDYLQSQDRIHRISQKKTCFIYELIMRDSIDEWVDSLLESKHYAAQLSQNDITLKEYETKADYQYAGIIKEILKGAQNE